MTYWVIKAKSFTVPGVYYGEQRLVLGRMPSFNLRFFDPWWYPERKHAKPFKTYEAAFDARAELYRYADWANEDFAIVRVGRKQ